MDIKGWLQTDGMKLGTIVTIDHPAIVEIARLAGFDWLWIDGEHGRFNEVSAATACAVNAGGTPLFTIPVAGSLSDGNQALSRYRMQPGIILPQLSSVAEVDEIARAALYPPRGERSVGIARAQGYGDAIRGVSAHAEITRLWCRSNRATGVSNAEAIIGHSAVDAVVIGPYDLSGSLGIPGEIEAPQVVAGISKVQALAKEARKPCGIFAATTRGGNSTRRPDLI